MQRTSLAFILTALVAALPETARAADPGTGGAAADPFAPGAEPKDPSSSPSVEDQEAAVLAPQGQPAPAPTPPPPVRRPAGRARQWAGDDTPAAATAPAVADQRGIAIELSTAGFASGSMTGGLFLGGRTAGGVILGGFLDYAMASNTLTFGTSPELTTSAQATRLGFGVRFVFVRTADRMVDLYGAADASFEHRGAETISSSGTMPTQSVSASGFSLAFGPGLRLWVHEKLAIGYAGRLRVTYLTGEFGALDVPPDESTTSASATAVGFDGTFQLLGVF